MTVFRDPWGIPHIRASSLGDLAFEQGQVTARDRAWQLEIERLRGEGRTAELLGPAGVEWDVFARRTRLEAIAQTAWSRLDTHTRDFLAAYVDGVNTAFDEGATGVELEALGASPGAWQPWTPLAVFQVQHVLFGSFPSKLFHARARDVLGEDADLFRTEGLAGGSNAYAVGGGRTTSGAPLVAGDPHRVFEAPNVYLQVRLACTDSLHGFDVVGLTFPGVPGVQHFGHAGSVAWAVTNAVADYQDLHPLSPSESVTRETQTIVVRDAAPVQIDVLSTARGPVVLGDPSDGTALVLQTPAHDLGDLGFGALLPLLRSRTVADVDAALEHWVEPVNNVVIADSAGRVLHRVAGVVPVRSDAGDWAGWVSGLPRTEVAPDGAFVTANERGGAAYDVLGRDFAPPFRADRIRELLSAAPALDATSAAEVLADVQQTQLAGLLDLVPAELRPAWGGAMDGSPGAAWFAGLRERVVDAICAAPQLSPLREPSPHGPLFEPWSSLPGRVAASLHVLVEHGTPFGIDLAPVVRECAAELATEHARASWPERHRFHPLHALEQFGLPHERTSPSTPLAGDGDTVRAASWLPGTGVCVRGSVARYAWDLADRSHSRWVVPLGISGDPSDPHHADQHATWACGGTLPLVTDWAQLTEETPVSITHRDLDPVADLDLLHGWVTEPRAVYWGMLDKPREEVGEIYAWIQDQPHLAAYVLQIDGLPVGLFQTWDPGVDELGEFYDREPGDLGVHLFLADTAIRAGHTMEVTCYIRDTLFDRPEVARLVVEPDAANTASIDLFRRVGFVDGPQVDLPNKVAQFAFLQP
ncbi:GNAT family N-acetyltransferase [Nocardioides cavernaquae]|uniref:Lysine N-acyltransferase MbtK n=1 Tax=Nocardioides cavernaquae TaxID=2321396 RepID=A0A3A5H8R1_9ACTN|nr:GNAT family N-acetyltransferase [Nocardioides cavernaquae]RJS47049.1 GNAT family N-acetyltransferase [Nocardioides cavernaquae]